MRFLLPLLCWGSLALPGCVWAGTLAQFRTSLGEIDVELYDADKPITVQNFLRYVQSGSYSNVFFHRWRPEFVIQGGGYLVTNIGGTNKIAAVDPFPAITNEYSVGRTFSNLYGTLAMARVGGQTNSATSQWFFNVTNNAVDLDNTDGGFTVFGHVVSGTNVLNRFNAPPNTNGLYWVNAGKPLDELPVLSPNPSLNDLIYVDISLLNVQVSELAGGQHEISWLSVSNRVNRVQFTTQFPPVWQELTRTGGTGKTIRAPDPAADRSRFYRVIVDY